MRILLITNYYPPCDYGWGYMQLCEEVADGLSARGHAIAVLTSTYRDGDEIARPYPVHRLLRIDPDWHGGRLAAWQFFVGRRQRERRADAHLRQLVAGFRPDVVFVWHTLGLPRVLFRQAEQLPGVVVAYYLADYLPEMPDEYIAYWRLPPVHWTAKLLKRPLTRLALYMLAREGKPILLKYENAICVSDYVRRRLVGQKLIPPTAVVIHNGIDVQQFRSSGRRRDFSQSVSLLYAGRLESHKGVHHILEALSLLSKEQQKRIGQLAIVGNGEPAYSSRLLQITKRLGLPSLVRFGPPVPRSQMPALLDRFDVLILPSSLEALSRMMQEAMAMGLLIISTNTGGSRELLAHEGTGLVFEPGEPESLAAQLSYALNKPDLAARLAKAGRQTVIDNFDIRCTVEQIETYLLDLVDSEGAL